MFRSVIAASAVLLLAAPALACTPVASTKIKLTACVDSAWQSEVGVGEQEFSYHSEDGFTAMLIITEKATLPMAQFRDGILSNAVKAAGKADDVKVVGERAENIDDRPFSVLEYTLPNGGSPLLFQNFYYSQPGFGSVQILVYSLVDDARTAAFRAGQIAGTVKIGE